LQGGEYLTRKAMYQTLEAANISTADKEAFVFTARFDELYTKILVLHLMHRALKN
jgi:hypothetical protein